MYIYIYKVIYTYICVYIKHIRKYLFPIGKFTFMRKNQIFVSRTKGISSLSSLL